jgi:diadenosine tetraphosphatase ApaH/serine/threonine PP2A family protein phosphatase
VAFVGAAQQELDDARDGQAEARAWGVSFGSAPAGFVWQRPQARFHHAHAEVVVEGCRELVDF